MADLEVDAIHLVRLALQGRTDDVRLLSRRILKTVAARRPDLAGQAQSVAQALAVMPTRGAQRVGDGTWRALAADRVSACRPSPGGLLARRVAIEPSRYPHGLAPSRFVGDPLREVTIMCGPLLAGCGAFCERIST